jgi:hypothetical protein
MDKCKHVLQRNYIACVFVQKSLTGPPGAEKYLAA